MYTIIDGKEVMDSKESREGYMEEFERRKGKGETL